jgi:hypothetical protein
MMDAAREIFFLGEDSSGAGGEEKQKEGEGSRSEGGGEYVLWLEDDALLHKGWRQVLFYPK